MMGEPELPGTQLMTKLSEVVGAYLLAQARAGAQALQLFDSWAGQLAPGDYREYVAALYAARHRDCARGGRADHPLWREYQRHAGGDARRGRRRDRRGLAHRSGCGVAAPRRDVAVQGNLDPVALLAPWESLGRARSISWIRWPGARGTSSTWGMASCRRRRSRTCGDWWSSSMSISAAQRMPTQTEPGALRRSWREWRACRHRRRRHHGAERGVASATGGRAPVCQSRYTLLEPSDRWGGKIRSERIEGDGGGPTIIEAGPDELSDAQTLGARAGA